MSHPETIGAYRILGVVGEGGMGVVYRAEHRTPGVGERQGPVVLKTLHPHLARRAEFRARFEQEAEICARIEHPGVVRFIDLILDRETAALVLAFVPGEPLNEQLEAWREPQALLGLLEELAATLDYLHTRSPNPIIHRDLKPSNVLVTPGGKPVLIDFGIARAGASTLTQTATAMGTPDYMAPEQELDAKRVDRRTDVYALGVIAFRLLTGTLPWEEGLSWSALFIRKDRGNLDLAASREAAHVFEHALAPSPEDRFRTASALVAALSTALSGEIQLPHPEEERVEQQELRPSPAFEAESDAALDDEADEWSTVRHRPWRSNEALDALVAHKEVVLVFLVGLAFLGLSVLATTGLGDGDRSSTTVLQGDVLVTKEPPALPGDVLVIAEPPVLPDEVLVTEEPEPVRPSRAQSACQAAFAAQKALFAVDPAHPSEIPAKRRELEEVMRLLQVAEAKENDCEDELAPDGQVYSAGFLYELREEDGIVLWHCEAYLAETRLSELRDVGEDVEESVPHEGDGSWGCITCTLAVPDWCLPFMKEHRATVEAASLQDAPRDSSAP